MDKDLLSIIEMCITPHVIELIQEHENIDEIEAFKNFCNSKTYDALMDQETAVWHFSPLTIYHMYESELVYGEILFPEEQ